MSIQDITVVGVYKKKFNDKGIPHYEFDYMKQFDTIESAREFITKEGFEIADFDICYELETDMFYNIYKCHE